MSSESTKYEIPQPRGYRWGYGTILHFAAGGVLVDIYSWESADGILRRLRGPDGLTERELQKLPEYLRQWSDLPDVLSIAAVVETALRRERRLFAVRTRDVLPSGHFLAVGFGGVELCNPDGGRVWQVPCSRRVTSGRRARRLLEESLARRQPVDGVRQTLCRWPSELV